MNITYQLTEREKELFKIFKENKGWLWEEGPHKEYFEKYKEEIRVFKENGFVFNATRWVGDMSPLAKIDFLTEFGTYILSQSETHETIHFSSEKKLARTVQDKDDI